MTSCPIGLFGHPLGCNPLVEKNYSATTLNLKEPLTAL